MQALVPQLPGQLKKRLGIEAGVNIWFASLRATLPGDAQQPTVAVLDAVVQMIERERVVHQRTEPGLNVGNWIKFEEEFRYGDACVDDASGLVYFVAAEQPPFVLCGSSMHVLDRRQPADQSNTQQVGVFYLETVLEYIRKISELADEAAVRDPQLPPGISRNDLDYGIWVLSREAAIEEAGWSGPVRLAGYARVLYTVEREDGTGPPMVLATPLYVEYPPTPRPSKGRAWSLRRGRNP